MSKDVMENTIRNMLHDKISAGTKKYDEDLAHYAREKDKSTRDVQREDYSLKFLESILYRSVTLRQEVKVRNDTKTPIRIGRKLGGKQNPPWEDYPEDAAPVAEKKGKSKGRSKGERNGKADKTTAPPKALAGAGSERPSPRPKKQWTSFVISNS